MIRVYEGGWFGVLLSCEIGLIKLNGMTRLAG
jgi:hypothetical protein